MEREQIIKALKVHLDEDATCEECPYFKLYLCDVQLYQDILTLISELTEENERLRNKPPFATISFNDKLVEQLAKEKIAEFELDITAIRTETAHIMVEKLKARLPVISPSVFENIAEEVLEEWDA